MEEEREMREREAVGKVNREKESVKISGEEAWK